MIRLSRFIAILLLLSHQWAQAQRPKDTVELIKEFNQVMSFTVRPYLHYRSLLSVRSTPAVRLTDTGQYTSEFYKAGDDLYFGNEQQEVFLQDSLMITLNHPRREIQVSKVDVATKSKIDLLPLRRANIQKLLREHYLISRDLLSGDTAEFVIRSQETRDGTGVATLLRVKYSMSNLRPIVIEVTLQYQQPASDEAMDVLRRRGIEAANLVQIRQGARWLLLSQTMTMQFLEMSEGRQDAEQMPLWTQKIAYDAGEQVFRGIGSCQNYEVTKTF